MSYSIRPATEQDIPTMLCIFEAGKQKMRQAGNLLQWTGNYPSDTILRQDISRGFSYIVECGETPIGTFVLALCEDPTYKRIDGGRWLDDTLPYGTIHRIASLSGYKGVADFVIGWSFGKTDSLRIDTHRDNTIMKHIMEKNGFTYCGIIYLANGDERLAYQKLHTRNEANAQP